MKKLLFAILIAVVTLTGCSKSDYETFAEEANFLVDTSAIELTMTSPEFEGIEISVTVDAKSDIMKMDFLGMEAYYVDEMSYVNVFGNWMKQPIDENDEDMEMFDDIKQYTTVFTTFPKGDEVISDNLTGDADIDAKINGKTYDELIKKTADNTYTIVGLEDMITIVTSEDKIVVTYTTDGEESVMTFNSSEALELPEAALDAIDASDFEL